MSKIFTTFVVEIKTYKTMRKHLLKFGPLYGGILGTIGIIGIICAYGLLCALSDLASAAFIGSWAATMAGMVIGLSDWD